MGNVQLKSLSTRAPRHINQERLARETESMLLEIIELQKKFYAWGGRSILIILQGMDASGKDGVIRSVFSGVNPLGIDVFSWNKPTDEEYKHDYLWRLHAKAPPKGMITVFNRSYYEDILVPSVQKFIKPDIIKNRYEHVNSFEKLLVDEGTIVLKFFLHISKEVQLTRLVDRIKEKEKHWKHDVQDFKSRKHWDEYMKVYQSIFDTTDTPTAPWCIIPSDDKWYKIHLITKTILSTLNSLPMKWPALVQPSPLYSHDKDSHPSDEKKLRKAAKEKEKLEKEAQKESKKAEKDRLKAQKKAAKAQKKLLKEKEKMAKKAEKEAKKLAKHKAKEAKKLEHKKEKIEKKSRVTSLKGVKAIPQIKKVVAKKTLPAKKPASKKAPTASKAIATHKTTNIVAPTAKKTPAKNPVAPKAAFKTTPLKKPVSAVAKTTPKTPAKK